MEAEESRQPLTNGIFQLTMETFSEEQSVNTRAVDGLVMAVKELTEKTDRVIGQMIPQASLLVEGISEDIATIKKAVTERPQNITKKVQILLFPEQDRKLFYRIVFGRWPLWFTIMLLLNNLFHFGINWSNNKSRTELMQLQNDRTKKAWDILYRDGNKKMKAAMEEAYRQGVIKQKRP